MPTKFCTTVMISMEFQPDMPHSLPFYLLLINDLKLSKKRKKHSKRYGSLVNFEKCFRMSLYPSFRTKPFFLTIKGNPTYGLTYSIHTATQYSLHTSLLSINRLFLQTLVHRGELQVASDHRI